MIYAISVFKNLESLEVCGGLITDAGVKNIKDLKALKQLNLSQNVNLTDKTLELISGIIPPCQIWRPYVPTLLLSICAVITWQYDMIARFAGLTALVSLNVSNTRISNAGLRHLKDLQNLRSLSLDSCRVTTSEVKKLQATVLPNLISVRPE